MSGHAWMRAAASAVTLRSPIWALALFCTLPAAQSLQEGQPPPFVGTPPRVVERMLAMARVVSSDTVIDLGSGDGRIVIEAAKRYGARGLGIEMDAGLVEASRRSAQREGVAERARFEQRDALLTDFSSATVLTLYLGPEFNERLLPRILALRPGTRVVSHDFAISTWPPDASEHMQVPEKNNGRGGESSIMLWIVPANAAGRWRASIGSGATSRQLEFSIAQQYQSIEGAVHAAAGAQRLSAASLVADRIAFELPPSAGPGSGSRVTARIDGDSMAGSLAGSRAMAPSAFVARRVQARPDLF